MALRAPKVVGVKANVSASVPQESTPVFDALTSQAAAVRFPTVRLVVVAFESTAPVAFKKVEVAEVKFARVAKRFVDVAFVEVEKLVSMRAIVEEPAMRPLVNERMVVVAFDGKRYAKVV